jgi:hypothetical protein
MTYAEASAKTGEKVAAAFRCCVAQTEKRVWLGPERPHRGNYQEKAKKGCC